MELAESESRGRNPSFNGVLMVLGHVGSHRLWCGDTGDSLGSAEGKMAQGKKITGWDNPLCFICIEKVKISPRSILPKSRDSANPLDVELWSH